MKHGHAGHSITGAASCTVRHAPLACSWERFCALSLRPAAPKPRQSPAPPSSESHPFSCASSACQVDHFPEDGVSSSVSPTGPRHLSQNRFVPLVHEALRKYPGALVGFAFCAQVRPSQPLRLAAEVQLRFGQEISSLIEADDHVTLVTSYVHLYRTRSIDLVSYAPSRRDRALLGECAFLAARMSASCATMLWLRVRERSAHPSQRTRCM